MVEEKTSGFHPTGKIVDNNFNKRYLVILADRKVSKIFTIYMNTFEDEGEVISKDDVPQKIKAVDGRRGKIERHILVHLQRHLKQVGVRAWDYLVKRNIRQLDGVVLGGHKEILPLLEYELPAKLKNKIKAEIITNVETPLADITQKILRILK